MKFVHLSAYCQNCGENISAEVAFCRSCGTALSESQVKANIEHSRTNRNLSGIHTRSIPVARKIAGTIIIGLLEAFFVMMIFIASLIISMNFFPDMTDGQTGRISTYLIVMTTTFAAGLTIGLYISKKFREKYPNGIHILNPAINTQKKIS